MCEECYSENPRITPLLNPRECLEKHTQYICGTCGRCICMEHDPHRGLQRWNFPFQSAEIAKLYLRTADATMKHACGIYEIRNQKGRSSFKIFPGNEELEQYLSKNKDKYCPTGAPVNFIHVDREYHEYPNTQIRRLTPEEIEQYLKER